MKRNIEDAKKLLSSLEGQIEKLPRDDIFGTSNYFERMSMTGYIQSLNSFIQGGPVDNADVQSWLDGPDDAFIQDFVS